MDDLVDYQVEDGIATITMDDGRVNALGPPMQAEIDAALHRANADSAVVVLAGRPGVFSAGFDLKVLAAGGRPAFKTVSGGFELAIRLVSHPYPVVIACTGHAVAMGSFLLLAADYRVGADGKFRIHANEVALGMTMPHTAIELMRQRLTPAAMNRASLLAEPFAPADAVQAGFLDRVVEPDQVMATARTAAAAARALDMTAHARAKARLRASTIRALDDALAADTVDLERTFPH